MKVNITRQLSAGQYILRFAVTGFTPEEVAKMNSFGVPLIQMRQNVPAGVQNIQIAITQINPNIVAGFTSEDQANKYQQDVLAQINQAMKSLRDRNDDFSSIQEVDI
jgi:hypothetical protein